MITSGNLTIGDVAHLLVRDRVIVQALEKAFGKAAPSVVATLTAREPVEIAPDIYNVIDDTLRNDARTYRRFNKRGSDGDDEDDNDTYSVEVKGLGGVYFFFGFESHVGYFDSLEAAESAVYDYGSGVDVWPDSSAPRRRPFGPGCKDAASSNRKRPTTRPPRIRTAAPKKARRR